MKEPGAMNAPTALSERERKSAVARLAGKSAPQENGCILWTGPRMPKGYGRISFRSKGTSTHRLAWMAAHGPIASGMHVCHKCDTPPCINVDHLFLGTCLDNNADKKRKGREAKGTRNGAAKLSPEKIRIILTSPLSGKKLGQKLGVGKTTVNDVRYGRTWKAEASSVRAAFHGQQIGA